MLKQSSVAEDEIRNRRASFITTSKEKIILGLRQITQSFFEYQPLDKPFKDSYEHFLLDIIPKVLKKNVINFDRPDGNAGRVVFSKPFYMPPTTLPQGGFTDNPIRDFNITNNDKKDRVLDLQGLSLWSNIRRKNRAFLPNMARKRNAHYMLDIYAKVEIFLDDIREFEIKIIENDLSKIFSPTKKSEEEEGFFDIGGEGGKGSEREEKFPILSQFANQFELFVTTEKSFEVDSRRKLREAFIEWNDNRENEKKKIVPVNALRGIIFLVDNFRKLPIIPPENFVLIGKIPLMLGSAWDWTVLGNKTRRDLVMMGECDLDTFSYVIINGIEKVFVTQEKLDTNRVFCIMDNSKKEIVAEMRSESADSNISEVVLRMYTVKEDKTKSTKVCVISMRFMDKDGKNRAIFNILGIFRFYIIWSIWDSQPEDMSTDELFDILGQFDTVGLAIAEMNRYLLNCCTDKDAYFEIFDALLDTFDQFSKKSVQIENDIKGFFEEAETDPEFTKDNAEEKKIRLRREDVEIFIRSMGTMSATVDATTSTPIPLIVNEIKLHLDNEFFPHMPISEDEEGNIIGDYVFAIKQKLENYGLPTQAPIFRKYIILSRMLGRFIKCYLGKKELDDRNHFGNKRLETVGISLGTMFSKTFRQVVRLVRLDINNSKNTFQPMEIYNTIKSKGEIRITKPIRDGFSKGEWGLHKKRPGVVQDMDRSGLIASWALLRKVSIPIQRQSKHTKPREVHPSQFGIVCSTATPENEACGLTKELAISAYITIGDEFANDFFQDIIETMRDLNELPIGLGNLKMIKIIEIPEQPDLIGEGDLMNVPLFLNNKLMGYGNGLIMETFFKKIKRSRTMIGHYPSVFRLVEIDQLERTEEVHIFTTAGRAVRPLFIVNDDGTVPILDILMVPEKAAKTTFTDLLIRKGGESAMVEYMSANETEFAFIAIDINAINDEVRPNGNRRAFTHMEIDPFFMMGVSVSSGPFPGLMPNPRVMYYAAQIKQPIGMVLSTFQQRTDTDLKILNYSEKPLVSTATFNLLGLDQQPVGLNMKVAVIAMGDNQEDAIIINKRSIDNGYFHSTLFETYKAKAFIGGEEMDAARFTPDGVIRERRIPIDQREDFSIDDIRTEIADIEDIDPNDVSKDMIEKAIAKKEFEDSRKGWEDTEQQFKGALGILTGATSTIVNPKNHDVLAAVRTKSGLEGEIRHMKLKGTSAGFVHRVYKSSNFEGKEVLKVVIRIPNIPGVGDKYASRYAQKGVIGRVMEYEEMPFDISTGDVPDIIINPASFPSRMTVGMLLEMLIGKATVVCNINHYVHKLVIMKPGVNEVRIKRNFYVMLEQFTVNTTVDIDEGAPILTYSQVLTRLAAEGINTNTSEFGSPSLTPKRNIFQRWLDHFGEYGWIVKWGIRVKVGEKEIKERKEGQDPKLITVSADYDFIVPETFDELPTSLKDESGKTIGDPAILFSQLNSEDQLSWFKEHKNELVSGRRIVGEKSKDAIIRGARDATAFRTTKQVSKEMEEILKEKGYNSRGLTRYRSGLTGKLMEGLQFDGPCYYMALKHLVNKKYQFRNRGAIDSITRQPVKGRSKEGAVRGGEMTKTALVAHGVTNFLKERFMSASDSFGAEVCGRRKEDGTICGHLCYTNMINFNTKCEACGSIFADDPLRIEVPYSIILIMRELSATGMGIRLLVRPEARGNLAFGRRRLLREPGADPRSNRRTAVKPVFDKAQKKGGNKFGEGEFEKKERREKGRKGKRGVKGLRKRIK